MSTSATPRFLISDSTRSDEVCAWLVLAEAEDEILTGWRHVAL
jgi:hypothetical protein